MDKLELDINFLVNNPEVKAAAEKAKADIAGVGQTAEQTFAKTTQAAKSGFNGLQNSINQISRELPAFTYSAQTGFMAIANNIPILTDQISQLRKENERLAASGQKGVPVWKQVVSGLFSWGTALSLGITLLTIYGKEIGNFFNSLFKGKEAFNSAIERFKSLNEAIKSSDYTTAYKGLAELKINLDLAKKGMASKEAVIKQYNESIGKTAGQVRTLESVEKGIAENADSYIKMTLYKAAANIQLAKASEEAVKQQEAILNSTKRDSRNNRSQDNLTFFERIEVAFTQDEGYTNKKIDEANNREIEEYKKAQEEKEKLANDFLKKASEEAKKMGGLLGLDYSFSDKEQKAFADRIKGIKDIREKLAALDQEYSGKYFTDDEKEQQALKEKFADFRKIIEEENAKIVEYNKNNKKKLSLIDVGQVAPIEQKAIVDLTYRQETESLKTSLEEQKQLYRDYEAYKKQVGVENAAKMFEDIKDSLGVEFDLSVSYLEKLQKEYDKLNGKEQKTGVEQERLKMLEIGINNEKRLKKDADNTAFATAYQAAKTHAQRLLDIQIEYQNAVKALGEKATAEQIAILQRIRNEKIQAENNANLEQETDYSNTLLVLDALSKGAALKELERIKVKLEAERAANGISVADYKQKIDEINGHIARINGTDGNSANPFKNAIDAVANWRKSIGGVADDSVDAKMAFKAAASAIGDAANGAADIVGSVAKGLDSLGIGGEQLQKDMANVEGMLQGVGDLAKGIATGNPVDIVKGSINLLTNAFELFNFKDKKAEKRIKAYQQQLKDLGKAFDGLERGINNSIGESYYADSEKAVRNLRQQQTLLQKSINDERSKKKADAGKIDAWQSELDAIPGKIQDINNAVTEMLVQTSFKELANNLSDAFAEAFKVGEDAAGRFDDVFNKVIQNAVKNSLKLKFIEKPVSEFTEALATYMKGNGNSVAGFDFAKWKAILKSAGDSMTGALQGFEDFFKTDVDTKTDDKTVSAAIKGITADQADLLAGQFGGQRIATLEGNELQKQGNETAMQQLAQAKQNGLMLVKIEDNTRRSAEVEEDYLPYLKEIASKMNNNNNALRAAGG